MTSNWLKVMNECRSQTQRMREMFLTELRLARKRNSPDEISYWKERLSQVETDGVNPDCRQDSN